MTSLAVIRAQKDAKQEARLRAQLAPYFGKNILVLSEEYKNKSLDIRQKSDRHFVVGGAFLAKRQIPYFKSIGWHCGDLMLYAARALRPEFDHYWMVESDVSLNIDVAEVFTRLEACPQDFLVPEFEKSLESWDWYPAGKHAGFEVPYRCFYPLVRMSRAAVAHLEIERAKIALPFIDGVFTPTLLPNDEIFSASVLMRDGFSCADLRKLTPELGWDEFSFLYPVSAKELPFIKDKVLHPVKPEGPAVHGRFAWLYNWRKPGFQTRYETMRARIGAAKTREYTGVPQSAAERRAYAIGPQTKEFHLRQIQMQLNTPAIKAIFYKAPKEIALGPARQILLKFTAPKLRIEIDLEPREDGLFLSLSQKGESPRQIAIGDHSSDLGQHVLEILSAVQPLLRAQEKSAPSS